MFNDLKFLIDGILRQFAVAFVLLVMRMVGDTYFEGREYSTEALKVFNTLTKQEEPWININTGNPWRQCNPMHLYLLRNRKWNVKKRTILKSM